MLSFKCFGRLARPNQMLFLKENQQFSLNFYTFTWTFLNLGPVVPRSLSFCNPGSYLSLDLDLCCYVSVHFGASRVCAAHVVRALVHINNRIIISFFLSQSPTFFLLEGVKQQTKNLQAFLSDKQICLGP